MEVNTEHVVAFNENEYPRSRVQLLPKTITSGEYQARFAQNVEELRAIQRLRYRVFKGELEEETGDENALDADEFDAVCHHILVKYIPTQAIIGTYRVQTNEMAQAHLGFYSDHEFDLNVFPDAVLDNAVEIGRVCVCKEHRNARIVNLLWRALGNYITWNKKRYAFGCSSMFTQDQQKGFAVLKQFEKEGHLHESIWAQTRPAFRCDERYQLGDNESGDIPKLVRTYINLFNAKICSPPALDKDFGSIDFLSLSDVEGSSERVYRNFFLL